MDGDNMKITREEVERVAQLARLSFPEEELDKYNEHFNSFLAYADVLNQVDVEGTQPTAHVLPIQNVLRKDEVRPSLDCVLALSNAPEQEDGYFKVPKVFEG